MFDNVLVSLSEIAKEGGQYPWHKHLTVQLPIITLVGLTKVGQVASCKKIAKKNWEIVIIWLCYYTHPSIQDTHSRCHNDHSPK